MTKNYAKEFIDIFDDAISKEDGDALRDALSEWPNSDDAVMEDGNFWYASAITYTLLDLPNLASSALQYASMSEAEDKSLEEWFKENSFYSRVILEKKREERMK